MHFRFGSIVHRVARVAARATTIPLSRTGPNRLGRLGLLRRRRRLRLVATYNGYCTVDTLATIQPLHPDVFMSTSSITGLLLDRSPCFSPPGRFSFLLSIRRRQHAT